MAYFAEIDSNNVVIRVLAACQDDIDANGGDQSEAAANHFQQQIGLTKAVGIKYIQTSEDGSFRKNFASPGMPYDSGRDAFVDIQPFPSWIFNETTCSWDPPVPKPLSEENGGKVGQTRVKWDEETRSWVDDG